MANEKRMSALEAYEAVPDPEKIPPYLWDHIDMKNWAKQKTVSGMRFLDDAEKTAKENDG